jgi:YHS domain-containing protein
MKVQVRLETRSAEHLGHRYYFCSQKCRDKFEQNPANYPAKSEPSADEANPPEP